MIPEDEQTNFRLFFDCILPVLIEKVSSGSGSGKKKRSSRRLPKSSGTDGNSLEHGKQDEETSSLVFGSADPDDLADFAEYIASETFPHLANDLRKLEYHAWSQDTALQALYALPLTIDQVATQCLLPTLDVSIAESLTAYGIVPRDLESSSASDTQSAAAGHTNPKRGRQAKTKINSDEDASTSSTAGVAAFLVPVLTSYLTSLTTPPPAPRSTRDEAGGCELCGRDWIPLSYHHLIPRAVHAKAVKRGWHRAEDLQNVAWLCAACHRFVHRFAAHEELARHYYTVERLAAEEPVRRWADWVGRIRWKAR